MRPVFRHIFALKFHQEFRIKYNPSRMRTKLCLAALETNQNDYYCLQPKKMEFKCNENRANDNFNLIPCEPWSFHYQIFRIYSDKPIQHLKPLFYCLYSHSVHTPFALIQSESWCEVQSSRQRRKTLAPLKHTSVALKLM